MKQNGLNISKRAARLVEEHQPLVQAHFTCAQNPWHKTKNPDGYINLGTAENHLVFDLLKPVLNVNHKFTESHTHYEQLHGSQAFRDAMSVYLTEMTGAKVPADRLVTASGSSAIIDMLVSVICEPGEGVIIPAPYYAGFDHDLKGRAGVVPIPAYLDPEENFKLNGERLQQALIQAKARDIKVKALLITSPNNPLGRTYSEDTLREIIRTARDQRIELISDELYARSVFGSGDYTSIWKLVSEEQGHLHLVYGFAKDFGLSGFKTGVLFSTRNKVLEAVKELAYFAPVSNATQHILTRMLENREFLDSFFPENASRLEKASKTCHKLLDKYDIPAQKTNAGFFVWMDLSRYLESDDVESEITLYRHILEKARVNLSPGTVFHSPAPGWFRLCYARPQDMIETAIERIQGVLG